MVTLTLKAYPNMIHASRSQLRPNSPRVHFYVLYPKGKQRTNGTLTKYINITQNTTRCTHPGNEFVDLSRPIKIQDTINFVFTLHFVSKIPNNIANK